MSAVTREDLEAKSAIASWMKGRQRMPRLAILFGANPLTTSLLRDSRMRSPLMFVETGDFRLRPKAVVGLLQERHAIHVPLADDDVIPGVRRVKPLGFPVDEAFRAQTKRVADAQIAQIGFAGRLEPEKGLTDLIDATRQLRAKGLPIELQVLGDGSEKDRLRVQGSTLEWFRMQEGIAATPQIRAFYDQLSVYVVPSTPRANEGLPVSMLEALLAGTQVVATDVGAIRDRMGDLVNIVPPSDPENLAKAIQQSLRKPPQSLDAVQKRVPTAESYVRALLDALSDSVREPT
jgi:glycosyltransferase involved in cell wall biosynthesis